MEDKEFGSGVASVFDAIASGSKAEPTQSAVESSRQSRKSALPEAITAPPNDPRARRLARMGRQPGAKQGAPKEKITGRISAELRNAYVDWSFADRCSLSELIERALTEFYQRHRATVESEK